MCSRQKREISKLLASQSYLCCWLKSFICKKACVYTTVRPNFGATNADQCFNEDAVIFARIEIVRGRKEERK